MAKTYTGIVLNVIKTQTPVGPVWTPGSYRTALNVEFTSGGRRYSFISPEESEMSKGHWFRPGTVEPAVSPGDTLTVRGTEHRVIKGGALILNRVRRLMPMIVSPPPPVTVDPVLDAVATYEAVMGRVRGGKLRTKREFTEAYEELEKADLVLIQTISTAQQHRIILDDHKALLLKRVKDAK